MQLKGNALKSFATQYPTDAAYFFSGPPYSMLVVKNFGYQNLPTFMPNEDVSDDDDNNNNKEDNLNKSNCHHATDDYFGVFSDWMPNIVQYFTFSYWTMQCLLAQCQ